jgi:hypothetical protein
MKNLTFAEKQAADKKKADLKSGIIMCIITLCIAIPVGYMVVQQLLKP